MKYKSTIVFLLLLVLLFTSNSLCAFADYTYQARVFSGNMGSFGGADVIKESDLASNSNIYFISSGTGKYSILTPSGDYSVTVLNAKYYPKGLRESGKDNNTYSTTVTVKRDQDYVIAWGIKGTEVTYTVHYRDTSGNTLAPSQTFYGSPGDKPVAAYIDIDGYRPAYRNITQTLSASGPNEFVFEYYPLPTITTTTTTTTTGTAGTNTGTNTGTNAGNNAGNANTNTGNNTIGNNTNAGNGNATLPGNLPTMPQEFPETQEILDLDVPLAAPDASPSASPQPTPRPSEKPARLVPKWILIVGALLLFGLVALVYWYLLFYRKKKQRDEEYENEYDDYGDT